MYNTDHRSKQKRLCLGAIVSTLCVAVLSLSSAQPAPPLDRDDFFEQRIRPVLVNECYECHGPTQQKGGLRLDFRGGLFKGGASGPAVVAGNAKNSLLVKSIRHEIPYAVMPKNRPRLPDSVIADFVTWINRGANDPRARPSIDTKTSVGNWDAVLQARKQWWSFQPLQNATVPIVKNKVWSTHPVDRFLYSAMEKRALEPSSAASRETLLRRVNFLLTGLTPTLNEVRAFSLDTSPNAYAKVVDRLLASPRFGERWARHWMDLVRYSESHGSQGDPELPMAWRYRDYLIRAFNNDVPYDQLVREHIAGDLLPNPRISAAERLNESILGTAHYRMVEFGYVPVDALDDQVKVVDNQIDVFSKTFLGLTVSCARCHNHKFDPISQNDFYALYGVFASSRQGQVVVDMPSIKQTNRASLESLKKEIKAGLGHAWEMEVENLPSNLLNQATQRAERERLETGIHRLNDEIADLEFRARTDLSRQRGFEFSKGVPTPLARWGFEGDLRDSRGNMHGKAHGAAKVRGGRLILSGTDAWVVTEPLTVTVREKTLEAWVTLEGLEQRGGGALTLQTPDSEVFDSIVFGEREPAHWVAGSDFFRRTTDAGGPAETVKPGELVHLAIVYSGDNTITIYRNGLVYGTPYKQGTLTTFAAASARILLGKRHLAPGVTSLVGEVEEARLYDRALTRDEILASFRSGTVAIAPETLSNSLTLAEREKRSLLQRDLENLQSLLSKQSTLMSTETWKSALADASVNNANPLHPWAKLAGLRGDAFTNGWNDLSTFWQREMESRREFNRTKFTETWNLRGDNAGHWFMTGSGAGALSGDFSVDVKGDRVLQGLYPAGVFTNSLTSKQNGVFTSPRFKVTTDNISVRALGDNSFARLVVENYVIGNGGLYPSTGLTTNEMKWSRLDTAYRKGANAYLEFLTADDSPTGSRSGAEGRAYFGAAEVVFHNGPDVPKETMVPAAYFMAGQTTPQSAEILAKLYGERLKTAIVHWMDGSLTDEEESFLDYFVRHDLLPTSLQHLPALRTAVATYRGLEAEIPVPRRAPGVHEAAGFDQSVFVRGQITQLGKTVPRRFLEAFGGKAFQTTLSGRKELANVVASPKNPLTARVMVNRIWHHVFGRGLVTTVDNFGRLGEKPSHPELLDYLANRFIQKGWSIKETIRFLVMSRAFQQTAVSSISAQKRDPANVLLSHARVRRLDAEAIRDSVLAVSGQLDLSMYGPGVDVYYVGKTEGGGPKGPLDGQRRRSLYQRIRRNASNPFLEAFDAPKPTSTRGKRDTTNVPAQSLTMLNDPFVIDQSKKWAQKLIAEGRTVDERIRQMFTTAFGRNAKAEEVIMAKQYLHELATEHAVQIDFLDKSELVWQDFAQALFCLKEFIYVN